MKQFVGISNWNKAILSENFINAFHVSCLRFIANMKHPENSSYSDINVNPKKDNLVFEGTCVGLLRDFS